MSSTEHLPTDPNQTDSKIDALRGAFRTFDSHQSLVTTLFQQWQEFDDSFSAAREIVATRQRELEVKEKELETREKELESRQKQLEGLERKLNCEQILVDTSAKSLEWKRKQLESLEKETELKRKQLEVWEKDLELKQNQLLELNKSGDNKDAQMNSAGAVAVESGPANETPPPLDDGEEASTSLNLSLGIDGKGLLRFLNDRYGEHHKSLPDKLYDALMKAKQGPAKLVLEAIDGFFAPHQTKGGGEEYDTGIVRNICLLLLEQLLRTKPRITDLVRVEARGLANRWLEKIKEEGENYLAVLSFLLLVATYKIASSFNVTVLERFLRLVQQDERATVIRQNLGKVGNKGTKQEMQECAEYAKVGSICANMDVDRFKSYLSDNALTREMGTWAIRSALNPGKLVFDVTLSFGIKASEKRECDSYRKGCISLLEMLADLSPKIDEGIRADAMTFARSWKGRLKHSMNKEEPWDVYGLFQFMLAFKLTFSFSADELFELYATLYKGPEVYENQKIATLCHDLGLADKIPGVVQTLIDDNQHICAVKYVCVLGLGNDFSPAVLLKAYLDNIQKTNDGKKSNGTCDERIVAINEECNALQSVIKCITDFKLGSEFPTSDLKKRRKLILKEKKELIKSHKSKADHPASSPKSNEPEPKPGTKKPAFDRPAEKKELTKSHKSKTDHPPSTPTSNKPEPEPGTEKAASDRPAEKKELTKSHKSKTDHPASTSKSDKPEPKTGTKRPASDQPAVHTPEKQRRRIPVQERPQSYPQPHPAPMYVHAPCDSRDMAPYAESPRNSGFEPPHGPWSDGFGLHPDNLGMNHPNCSPPGPWGMDHPNHSPPGPWGMDHPNHSPSGPWGMDHLHHSPPGPWGMDQPNHSPPGPWGLDHLHPHPWGPWSDDYRMDWVGPVTEYYLGHGPPQPHPHPHSHPYPPHNIHNHFPFHSQ